MISSPKHLQKQGQFLALRDKIVKPHEEFMGSVGDNA